MHWVIAFLLAGIVFGIYLRKRKHLSSKLELSINITIYLLLFTLGLKAGSDDAIMERLHSLGLNALIISTFTIGGSVLMAWFVYHFFFKKETK